MINLHSVTLITCAVFGVAYSALSSDSHGPKFSYKDSEYKYLEDSNQEELDVDYSGVKFVVLDNDWLLYYWINWQFYNSACKKSKSQRLNHDAEPPSKKRRIDYAPKSGETQSVCLDSPIKRKMADHLELVQKKPNGAIGKGHEVNIIYFDDTDFDNKLWAFFDPFNPESTVIVNGNAKIYDSIVDEFLQENKNIKNAIIFIAKAIFFINKNKENLANKAWFSDRDGDGVVCRHYATFSLPFFAKLLKKEDSPHNGTIQFLSSSFLNYKLQEVLEGHSWNIVTIKNCDNKEIKYFVDIYNKKVVELTPSMPLEELKIYRVSLTGKIFYNSLAKFQENLDCVRASLNKIQLGRPGLFGDLADHFDVDKLLEELAEDFIKYF